MQYLGSVANITSVSVSATSAVLATTGARKYAIVYNASGSNLYLAFGDTAATSAGNYTVVVSPNSAYEIPGIYQGALSGVLNSGSGNVSVTIVT